jgi:hypothetical protein
MSSGQKDWADEIAFEYERTTRPKHEKRLAEYMASDEYKRLLELRAKFKELNEYRRLEERARKLIQNCELADDDLLFAVRTTGL